MKPRLDLETIKLHLRGIVGDVRNISPLSEGEESQVVAFRSGDDHLVLRIGADITGYRKDALAHRRYPALPIPEVLCTGWLERGQAYAISRFVDGITLQDADDATIRTLLPQITDLWISIGSQPLGRGYGVFTIDGDASFDTWPDVIAADMVVPAERRAVDSALIRSIIGEVRSLLPALPGERSLVHGDFGSNNVLIDSTQCRIAAVLDWDCAMYGDPLVDIATAFFWRRWLHCMEVSAQHWEAELAHLPNVRERLRCYQLWIGLRELIANDGAGDIASVRWLSQRCREVLAEG